MHDQVIGYVVAVSVSLFFLYLWLELGKMQKKNKAAMTKAMGPYRTFGIMKFNRILCPSCGQPFSDGDEVTSMRMDNGWEGDLWHVKCWRESEAKAS